MIEVLTLSMEPNWTTPKDGKEMIAIVCKIEANFQSHDAYQQKIVMKSVWIKNQISIILLHLIDYCIDVKYAHSKFMT